jgi:mono/diheme cytochrome c family protein
LGIRATEIAERRIAETSGRVSSEARPDRFRLTGMSCPIVRIILVGCAVVLGASAQAGEPQVPGSAQSAGGAQGLSASSIERGRSLYARHCSHCHGFNMINPGTISYDLRKFPKDDEARFLNSVTHGKNGRMPPWGAVLSREEMEQIWAYVATGGKQ